MAAQHGLITSAQARGLGLTTDDIGHRVERGEWVRRTRHVLAATAGSDTTHRRLMLQALDAGASSAISHTTALAHWGVRGFVADPIHVTRHRDHLDHKVAGAILHEVRYLPWDQIRVLEGIPVIVPAIALLQLAGMAVHRDRLARAIDAAWADRLVSHATLTAAIDRMSRRGRRGLTRFRELVDERGAAYVPPASNLESRFVQLLDGAGLPPMRRQVDSGDGVRWIGRVDFRAEDCPLIVEVQSERFHRGLLAERDDLARFEGLRATGFVVVTVTDTDLFHRPADVVEHVAAGRAQARGAA